jgi:catechol 2,3-dioxygenase-like lactoylglutathione lyase family enzyme
MSVTEMEHVLVLSEDIEASRDFYCRVVGLQVGERPALEFPGYWLYAGATPCVHVADRSTYLRHAAWLGLTVPHEPPGAGYVDHIAFNASDYEAVRARLKSNGVPAILNVVPGGGLHQVFFDDPNGVRIEINVRRSTSKRGRDG